MSRLETDRLPTAMADDWRVTIDFDDEGDGTQLAEWLAAVDLEGEERSTLGERVIVSRDGPRVYLYADSEPGVSVSQMCPSRITGGRVTSGPFHGTSSMSISMMRTLGSTAPRCNECRSARWL